MRVITDRPKRIFAIGDLHGCLDELNLIITFLKEEQGACSEDLFVFIGDYIDRGKESRQVIEYLLSLQSEWPRTVFIKGNHEDMLLDFLGLGGRCGDVYLSNGGDEFLKSYGLDPALPQSELLERLPVEHLEFLKKLELAVCLAEFVFVHAGVSPDRPLEEQDLRDLMWIRADFIHAEHRLGKTVVFGHTPFEDVLLHLPFKIGIDTGLVYGNKLSVVELVHGTLYQVEREGLEVGVHDLSARLLTNLR